MKTETTKTILVGVTSCGIEIEAVSEGCVNCPFQCEGCPSPDGWGYIFPKNVKVGE